MVGPDQGEPVRLRDWVRRPPPYASQEFSRFLDEHSVVVLDVVPGAAFGTRRVLVGEPNTGVVRYAAAVGQASSGIDSVAREELVLTQVREALRPVLRSTMPRVVQRAEVFTNISGLVVTGVPGLRPAGLRPPLPQTRDMLAGLDRWLTALWRDTAGEKAQIQLGADAVEVLLGRYAGTAPLQPAVERLRAARQRLAEFEAPRTLHHGCLCLRHTMFEADEVVGVDDWGMASPTGGPLGDLGEFVVRVAGDRLPEVLAGRSSYAAMLRQFVGDALARTAVPRQLWREVLMLAQLQLAVAGLERDDHDAMVLLARAVHALTAHTR